MSGLFRIPGVAIGFAMAGVVLVESLGAVRSLEFMAFAGNAGKGDGQGEQRE